MGGGCEQEGVFFSFSELVSVLGSVSLSEWGAFMGGLVVSL